SRVQAAQFGVRRWLRTAVWRQVKKVACVGEHRLTAQSAGALHRRLFLEVVEIAIDRGDRQHLAIAAITDQTVACLDDALDVDSVPFLRVTDIIDGDVVVLAPEEGHVGEWLPLPEHVAGDGLPLALGHYPMLDPKVLAGVR